MTKPEFIKALSERTYITQSMVTEVIEGLPDVIMAALQSDGECPIPGLGKLVLTHRNERTGRNPKTGESLIVPASKGIKFRPIAAVKEAIK